MKLNVKNIGVIKEANIDLTRPLTIFCGQNGTGKTYLSYIIYALENASIYTEISTLDINYLLEHGLVEFDLDIEDIYKYKNELLASVKNNIGTIFGISEAQVNELFANFSLSCEQNIESLKSKIIDIEDNENFIIDNVSVNVTKQKGDLKVKCKIAESSGTKSSLAYIDYFLPSAIYKYFAFFPFTRANIFSVERNSIFTFSKELSINRNALIEQMQKLAESDKFNPLELLQSRSKRYPMAISDGLKVSNDLTNLQKHKSIYFNLAEEIERDLLNGVLSVNRNGELQYSSNKNKSKKLPIHMCASFIKTLSSLVFYLKHIAEKGDLIIIDEPEMNIHPENQIILTKIFAKLLNNKLRLLISTHSDYILREFNNLIMVDRIKDEEKLNLLGYSISDSINFNNIGCYYFNFPKTNSRYAKVDEIDVSNYGFEVPSIDETISSQNRKSEELYYLCEYGE